MAGTTIGIIDFSSQMTVYAPPGYAPFEQKCAVKSPHLTVNPFFVLASLSDRGQGVNFGVN